MPPPPAGAMQHHPAMATLLARAHPTNTHEEITAMQMAAETKHSSRLMTDRKPTDLTHVSRKEFETYYYYYIFQVMKSSLRKPVYKGASYVNQKLNNCLDSGM